MRSFLLFGCVVTAKKSNPSARPLPRIPQRGKTTQTRICLAGWLAVAVAIAAVPTAGLAAAARLGSEPIVVTGARPEPANIAVPTFDGSRSPVPLNKANDFHDIIYKDLELTGYFQRGSKHNFVDQTRALDRKADKVDFAEWRRLEADWLLVGSYDVAGDRLEVTCILYYVVKGKRVFGKRFANPVEDQRVLAHRISDEIFRYVTGEEGVANTKILYVSTNDRTRRVREVWAMDADGANKRPLTNDKSLAATPCWGANATEFYYTSYKDYNPDLCGSYLSKDSAPWFISRFPGLNVSPAWLERRKRIALTLGKDGNSEIYLMSREGKNLKRLTYDRAIDSSPQWSPDGNMIAFTSDRTGTPQIYVMDAEGFNVRRISFVGSTYCDSAAWSPKGDKIAFTARRNGKFDIYASEIDGSNAQRLTQGQGNSEDPFWAPNGLMLAFSSDRGGASQIYVMHVDGSAQRRLTHQGYNTSAAWSPDPYGK